MNFKSAGSGLQAIGDLRLLLSVISDPKSAKNLLEEIEQKLVEHQDVLDKILVDKGHADNALKESSDHKKDIEEKLALISKKQKEIELKEKSFSSRESELSFKEQDLSKRIAEFEKQKEELTDSLTSKLQFADMKFKEYDEANKKAVVVSKEYEEKVSKLKAAVL